MGAANEIISALIQARSKFKPIRKDKTNSYLQTKYATLDAILEAVETALCENGLTIVQTMEVNDGGITLKTSLYHESGQVIHSYYPLPQKAEEPQKLGIAITYGRRYSLCGILSITADEDDDGNAAMPRKSEPSDPSSSKSKAGTISKSEWEARKRQSQG